MTEPPLRDVASRMREEAELFRRRGDERAAEMAESYADDLEDALRKWWYEELTLKEAAAEQGCSYSKMQKMVSRGEIPNAGEKGDPAVRRCDLPRHRQERDPLAHESLTAV